MNNLYLSLGFGFVIMIVTSVYGAYLEDKKTVRYEACVKYHSPKECK